VGSEEDDDDDGGGGGGDDCDDDDGGDDAQVAFKEIKDMTITTGTTTAGTCLYKTDNCSFAWTSNFESTTGKWA
jgi:hypothetical protein